MAGPTIGNPTPDWMRAENASVLDPALVKVARALAHMLGLDDPMSQVTGALNPTPSVAIGIVPRKPVSALMERFAGEPQAYRDAVRFLSERYPRLMSHVAAITDAPLNASDVMADLAESRPARVRFGRHSSIGPAAMPGRIQRGMRDLEPLPTSVITFDRRVHDAMPPATYLDTLAHETTHAAQNLRQTDRALRNADDPPFVGKYAGYNTEFGYRGNPYEVSARATAAAKVDEAPAIRLAREILDRGVGVDQAVARLKRAFDGTGMSDDYIRRVVRVADTMKRRGAE